MVSDRDLTCGLAMAVVLLLVIMCVWPGAARAGPGDLRGYWADFEGHLYEIVPAGGRNIMVRGSRPGSGGSHGRIAGLRRLVFQPVGRGGPARGRLDFGGRSITWDAGSPDGLGGKSRHRKWIRQGA